MSIPWLAKKSFMTGYNFGHDVLGPAVSRIKAMEHEDEGEGLTVDKDYVLLMDKMNNLMNFQSQQLVKHTMPGLDDLLGQSFHGGPAGFILKRITTKYTLSEVTNSTSGIVVYNVDKIGRLMKAQFTGSTNNAGQLNLYSNLSEARQPQSGDYLVAANLIAQDNTDGNDDTGQFTGGFKGLRSKSTVVQTKLYDDFEALSTELAQTSQAKTIPFRGHTAISVCTPSPFLIEHEQGATISNFLNDAAGQGQGAADDPKSRMGLCIAYEGLKDKNDVERIMFTLHEYYLSAPSPDMHQMSSHSTPKHHINELLELTYTPVNIL